MNEGYITYNRNKTVIIFHFIYIKFYLIYCTLFRLLHF